MGAVQGDVSHALHRLRPLPPSVSDGHVADDALHDQWGHVLRHVLGARHQPHPEPRLFQETIQREGRLPRFLSCLVHIVLGSLVNPLCISGQASGGVHGVQEAAAGDAHEDHGVLRAPLSGQVLR